MADDASNYRDLMAQLEAAFAPHHDSRGLSEPEHQPTKAIDAGPGPFAGSSVEMGQPSGTVGLRNDLMSLAARLFGDEEGRPAGYGVSANAGPVGYQQSRPMQRGAAPQHTFTLNLDPREVEARLQAILLQGPGGQRSYGVGANSGNEEGGWNLSGMYDPQRRALSINGGMQRRFAEGGSAISLRERLLNMLKGDDYQSTGQKTVDDGTVNWGDPENAADFFRADKARMEMERKLREDESRPAPSRVIESRPPPPPDSRQAAPEEPAAQRTIPGAQSPLQSDSFVSASAKPIAYAPDEKPAALRAIEDATDKLNIRDISHMAQYRGSAMEEPEAVVFHHTAGRGTPESVVNTLNNRVDPFTGRKMILGVHYIIDRDGSVHAALPSGTTGAHVLTNQERNLSNQNTIGVEVIAKDNDDVTPEQVEAGKLLHAYLSSGRKKPLEVFGHGELNPGHKLPNEGLAVVNPIRNRFKIDAARGYAEGGPFDEDTYGPANIEERRARLEERLAAERKATRQYPGDELEAPKGYITPAKAVKWVQTDAGPMAVDEEGNSLPLIQQPGVLPLYRDPTIDSVRMAMPRMLDIAGDVTGAPAGITAARVLQAGVRGERPAANVVNIFAGEKAKTADMDKLSDALWMSDHNIKSPEAIRRETGWFQGADGQWRFEIPDYKAKLNEKALFDQPSLADLAGRYFEEKGVPARKLSTGQFPELDAEAYAYARKMIEERPPARLGDVLDHPEFFAAYPEAADVPVNARQMVNARGSYNPNTNEISLSQGRLGDKADELRSTALHELQHYVQNQEGFARGANTTFLTEDSPAWDLYQKRLKEMKRVPSLKEYAKSAGFDSLEEARPSWEAYAKDIKSGGWRKWDTEAQKSALEEAYRRSAGEVEARNVQARRNMGPDTLRLESPKDTQAIPDKDQLVQFRTNGPEMSAPERDLNSMGLYSHGAESAMGLPQAKGTPEQMAALLQKYGVKPDEMFTSGFADEAKTVALRAKVEAEFAPKVEAAQKAMEGLEPGTKEFKAAERQFKNISSTMRSEMDRALVLGDEWAARPSVTSEEIAAHFKERMPQVEETVLGGKQAFDANRLKELESEYAGLKEHPLDAPSFGDDKYNEMIRLMNIRDQSSTDSLYAAAEDAMRKAQQAQRRGDNVTAERYFREHELLNTRAEKLDLEGEGLANPTKFSQYTLPGGENYREVLLKLPENEVPYFKDFESYFKSNFKPTNPTAEAYYRQAAMRNWEAANGKIPNYKGANDYLSSHWDDPNVLAHLRMADRTGPNGEKILHVEEIQSDWGQQGKKEGFANPADKQNMPELIKKYDGMNAQRRDLERIIANGDDISPETQAAVASLSDLNRQMEALAERMDVARNGLPSAPYVTSTQGWTDLALKRALKEAAEGGYDKLVWTPGVEQAKRYSLRNQVDELRYMKNDDGTYNVIPFKDGSALHRIERENIPEKELESMFGRDVAKKMQAYEGDVSGNVRSLSGQNLEVGGEGMKGYYDKIVPTQLQKLVKKLDPEAKIGRDKLVLSKGFPSEFGVYDRNGDFIRSFPNERQASEYISNYANGRGLSGAEIRKHPSMSDISPDVHSLTITPKMRENILKGMPHMAEGGAVRDSGATEAADLDTLFQKYADPGYAKGGSVQGYAFGGLFDNLMGHINNIGKNLSGSSGNPGGHYENQIVGFQEGSTTDADGNVIQQGDPIYQKVWIPDSAQTAMTQQAATTQDTGLNQLAANYGENAGGTSAAAATDADQPYFGGNLIMTEAESKQYDDLINAQQGSPEGVERRIVGFQEGSTTDADGNVIQQGDPIYQDIPLPPTKPAYLQNFDYSQYADPLAARYAFLSKALNPTIAAAAMGNFQAESGNNPNQLQTTTGTATGTPLYTKKAGFENLPTGYGSAQWGTTRLTNLGANNPNKLGLYDFAERYGFDPNTTEGQDRFVVYELTTNPEYRNVYKNLLKSGNDVAGATYIFGSGYESPANLRASINQRQQDAAMYQNLYTNGMDKLTEQQRQRIANTQKNILDPYFNKLAEDKAAAEAKRNATETAIARTGNDLGDVGFNPVTDTSVNDRIMQDSNTLLNQGVQNSLNYNYTDPFYAFNNVLSQSPFVQYGSGGAQTGYGQDPSTWTIPDPGAGMQLYISPYSFDFYSPYAEGGSVGFKPMFDGDSEILQSRAKQLARQAYTDPKTLTPNERKEWNQLAGKYNLPPSSGNKNTYEEQTEETMTGLQKGLSSRQKERTYAKGGLVYDPAEIDAIAAQIRGAI